jgi:hypothetical protein
MALSRLGFTRMTVGGYNGSKATSLITGMGRVGRYSLEGIAMPYSMEQFRKDYVRAHLSDLDPEEVLSRFGPEERLKGLGPEEVFCRFGPEERLKGVGRGAFPVRAGRTLERAQSRRDRTVPEKA